MRDWVGSQSFWLVFANAALGLLVLVPLLAVLVSAIRDRWRRLRDTREVERVFLDGVGEILVLRE